MVKSSYLRVQFAVCKLHAVVLQIKKVSNSLLQWVVYNQAHCVNILIRVFCFISNILSNQYFRGPYLCLISSSHWFRGQHLNIFHSTKNYLTLTTLPNIIIINKLTIANSGYTEVRNAYLFTTLHKVILLLTDPNLSLYCRRRCGALWQPFQVCEWSKWETADHTDTLHECPGWFRWDDDMDGGSGGQCERERSNTAGLCIYRRYSQQGSSRFPCHHLSSLIAFKPTLLYLWVYMLKVCDLPFV